MTVLDGKRLAEKMQQQMAAEIGRLKESVGRQPGLAVILVGDNPASKVYVGSKKRTAEAIGIHSRIVALPETVTIEELLERLQEQNDAPEIDAILVQMPLPKSLDSWEIIERILPGKDADCFHPQNQGRLLLGRSDFFPCTPAGILKLLDEYRVEVDGMNAAVVGRSFLVGKPLAVMLAARSATVTLCHSHTRDLQDILRRSDLVVAATGAPGLVQADMVRDGVVLVDVGTTRIDNEADFARLCPPAQLERFRKNGHVLVGDIHYRAHERSSFYTPVPGGIGPMTVAMLMHNTLHLYKKTNVLGG